MYNQRPQTSVLEDVEEFGAFDSQGYVPTSIEETPHYCIVLIVLPFRLKSENFIVLNTCNLCYSLVIAMNKDRQSSIKLK